MTFNKVRHAMNKALQAGVAAFHSGPSSWKCGSKLKYEDPEPCADKKVQSRNLGLPAIWFYAPQSNTFDLTCFIVL